MKIKVFKFDERRTALFDTESIEKTINDFISDKDVVDIKVISQDDPEDSILSHYVCLIYTIMYNETKRDL